ncbi:MAG: hypothetical protein ACRDBG_28230 [Waterburya sp.]
MPDQNFNVYAAARASDTSLSNTSSIFVYDDGAFRRTSLAVLKSGLAITVSDIPTLSDALGGKAANVHTHTPVDITDLKEFVDDRVNALIVVTGALTKTYNDTTDQLTLDVPTFALPEHTHAPTAITDLGEFIDDRVNALITVSGSLTKTYDDTSNTLTFSVPANSESSNPSYPENPNSGSWVGQFSNTSTGAITANRITYVPIYFSKQSIIDRLAAFSAAAATGGLVRMAIYTSHPTTHLPNTFIAEIATELDFSTGGQKLGTFASNPTIPAGLNYIALIGNLATIQTRIAVNSSFVSFLAEHGVSIPLSNLEQSIVSLVQILTYPTALGGFPATATSTIVNAGGNPTMFARVL